MDKSSYLSSSKSCDMSHLTEHQRYTISNMLENGYKQSEIAKVINKDKSVVCREIKRNCDQRNGQYKSDLAIRKHRNRQKEKHKCIRFTEEVQSNIEQLLKEDYSPEQVVNTLKKQKKATVSIERIYQHVWQDKKKNGDLHSHLRRQGRRYRKRGNLIDNRGIITNKTMIDKRPEIVDKRERFGDLEVDLIIGKNHKKAIVTINDRACGVLKMKKVNSKKAEEVQKAITDLLEEWIPYLHTITSDNGKEFAEHLKVAEKLNIDYYFAHPYHSWERGSNENLNGLIRQYIPKKTDLDTVSDEYIKTIEKKLNNRPRKRFNYENPIFVMNKLLFNQKLHL